MILDDVFLPDHPRVRPVRRAVDLFRTSCSKEEWDGFTAHIQTCMRSEKSKYRKKAQQVHAMALDLRPPDVTIRDTEKKRVPANQFDPFYDWVEKGPEWYRNLLRLKLELWSLEVPPGNDQSSIRQLYVEFAKEFGSRHWIWDHRNQVGPRIEDLKKQIAAIPVPRRDWTEDELKILGGQIQLESFVSLLDDLPPYSTQMTPISAVRELQNSKLSPLEQAAHDYLLFLVKDLPELDVANWPFLPFVVRLPTERGPQPVLFVFRSNGRTSRVPRLAEKFGYLNLMSWINDTYPDDSHPLWLGQLDWSGDRVILMKTESLVLVRTWANASKVLGENGKRVDLPFAKRFFAVWKGDRIPISEEKYHDRLKKHGTSGNKVAATEQTSVATQPCLKTEGKDDPEV